MFDEKEFSQSLKMFPRMSNPEAYRRAMEKAFQEGRIQGSLLDYLTHRPKREPATSASLEGLSLRLGVAVDQLLTGDLVTVCFRCQSVKDGGGKWHEARFDV